MRVYLDNCCLNRPFDDQTNIRVRLETEAKLHIQEMILKKQIELAWSYIIAYENQFNPFEERRDIIERWKIHAAIDVEETAELISNARMLHGLGVKSKDALHVACAIEAHCDYFLSTDDSLLKRLGGLKDITALNPLSLVTLLERNQ